MNRYQEHIHAMKSSPLSLPKPRRPAFSEADSAALKWIRDCGWCGWLHSLVDNTVTAHTGEMWETPVALRAELELIEKWPPAGKRNIPARSTFRRMRAKAARQND